MTRRHRPLAPCLTRAALVGALTVAALSGCARQAVFPEPPDAIAANAFESPAYRLGPDDVIELSVWRSPELSARVPVRPDGRFSTPLVEDMQASGKTTTELARDVEKALAAYVREPKASVKVAKLGNRNSQSVRVLGQVTTPASLPYRAGMRVTDVLTAVGGVSEFADGNRSVLVRGRGVDRTRYSLRLDDLVRDGDVSADRPLLPGDIIIIPESFF